MNPTAFSARTVLLVEGISDQRALEALAARRGRNLDAEGVSIVPIGGAPNDHAEERDYRRGLERAGLGSNLTRAEMEALGFMGSGGRRKIRYARLLVDALDLTHVPRPLDRVLAHASPPCPFPPPPFV